VQAEGREVERVGIEFEEAGAGRLGAVALSVGVWECGRKVCRKGGRAHLASLTLFSSSRSAISVALAISASSPLLVR